MPRINPGLLFGLFLGCAKCVSDNAQEAKNKADMQAEITTQEKFANDRAQLIFGIEQNRQMLEAAEWREATAQYAAQMKL